MTTILLPTDFSANSINAINFAVSTFKNKKCRFILLHFHMAASVIADDLMTMGSSASIYQTLIETSKASLSKVIETLKTNDNNHLHEFIPIVDYDNFVDAVNQTCKSYYASLIIMSTNGATGLESVIFGSNTVHLMERSNHPILAIPNKFKLVELNRWAFGVDFQMTVSKDDVKPLLELAHMTDALIDIIYVNNSDEALSSDQMVNKETLIHHFESVNHDFVVLYDENILKAISEYSDVHHCDAMALVNKKHNFLYRLLHKDNIKTFGRHIVKPILVMPCTSS